MADICLNSVHKAYDGQAVLQNINACFVQGKRVALMGSSGRGKTTLVRLLLGLEKPDSGTISVPPGARFCPVFQEDRLCEGFSAVENIALVLPRARRAQIEDRLALVGLTAQEFYKPVGQLSGGQRRRVALVRAVEAEGDVLVLDEAFKGLDDATRAQAYQYVLQNLRGRTLLLVTHDRQEAEELCEEIIIL